jgi:GPH family glycoside/pentoside/hexuronide:cation symporter
MAELAGPQTAVETGSPAQTSPTSTARFGFKEKLLYSVGDVADGMKNTAIGGFVLIYLNAVLGLPGSVASLASVLALLIDAVLDPLIGYASDNTRSKWGRRHPYMIGAAVPFALGLGLMFSIPGFDSTWAVFAYAFAVLVVLRVAFSAFALPYAAIGAELAHDYRERSTVMTLRTFFNWAGILSCYGLAYWVFLAGDGIKSREAYVPFGWTCAAIISIAIVVSWWSTRNLRHLMFAPETSAKPAHSRVFTEFGEVFRNRSFIILFVTCLTFWASYGAASVLNNHVFLYFWKVSSETAGAILIAMSIGGIAGIPIAGTLLQYFEKRDVSTVGLAALCLCQFLPVTLALLGLMPEQGQGWWLFALLWSVYFIVGVVWTFVGIAFGSMMMDAADEHELLYGSRREGLYFAGLVFSVKAAVVVGLMIAGVGLDLIGFPAGIANNPDETLAPDVWQNLGIMAGPGAALLSLTSVLVLMRYRLVRTKVAEIQHALKERRAAAAST